VNGLGDDEQYKMAFYITLHCSVILFLKTAVTGLCSRQQAEWKMPPPKHRQTTQKHNNAFGPIHRTGRGTKNFYVKELILQDYSLTKITSKDSAIHHNNIDTVCVAT